jgi:hypothetical protein
MLWSKDVAYVRLSDANEIIAERDALKARIAKLEAALDTLVRWFSRTRECHDGWTFQDEWYATIKECQAAIRKALETPNSGERREGEG